MNAAHTAAPVTCPHCGGLLPSSLPPDFKPTENVCRESRAPGAKLYAWRWVSGGYNSAHCDSREDAVAVARQMGMGKPKGVLVLDLQSLVVGKAAEKLLNEMDRACMFD